MHTQSKRILALLTLTVILAGLAMAYPHIGKYVGQYWDYVLNLQANLAEWDRSGFLAAFLAFVGVYSLFGALCLPGTGLLNLTGAGLFPPLWALAAICLARAVGGLAAFLLVRRFFVDRVGNRFPARLEQVRQGFAREGGVYLFALRLTPGMPYPLTNILMGLTPIRSKVFFLVTLLGSVPGTLVSVNAIHQVTQIDSPSAALSPMVIGSLALIGLLPLGMKKGLVLVRWCRS